MAKHIKEIWKPVVNCEGLYEVSNLGRVRSLPGGRRKGVVLRQNTRNSDGYACVGLYPNGGPRPTVRNVHILVLEAFAGPRPDGGVARHLNDVRSDNRLSNLAWGTYRDNEADKRRNGGDKNAYGEGHYGCKYSARQVQDIHEMLGLYDVKDIARIVGVRPGFVYDVKLGRTRRRG